MTKNHSSLAIDPYYDGVPTYMTEVYDWAYVDPKWVRALDHNWVVRVLLFLNDQRLMRAYLNEIKPGMRVWQLAHVYGDLVTRPVEEGQVYTLEFGVRTSRGYVGQEEMVRVVPGGCEFLSPLQEGFWIIPG